MDQKIGVFGTGSIPLLVKIQKKCKNMSSFFISCKIVQYLSNDALLLNSSSTKQREATSCSYGSSNKQGKKRTFFIYLPHIGLDQPHSTPLSLHKLFTAPNISPTSAFYTVKPLIKNTSKEYSKCRILHFLILECCRYIVF